MKYDDAIARRQRRRKRLQLGQFLTGGALLVGGALLIGGLGAGARDLEADDATSLANAEAVNTEVRAMQREMEDLRGRLALNDVKLHRATAVLEYSARYKIPGDLAAAIYDIALTEGIQPAIGFQLVRVESSFKPDARSHMGAIGYTQLRLPTARSYEPTITVRDLHDRDLNLRIGFRYLRDLLRRFNGDLHLALVAYNRGPTLVDSILVEGGDPSNGYSDAVMRRKRVVAAPDSAAAPPAEAPRGPTGN
jgi:soluble lytic murein transglycosylase-like protein